ncbi:DUF86 domain-containing protein [Bdellovibrionota bacterium FG-2]
MPPRNWTIRINDILEAIKRVEKYTNDISFSEFEGDEKTVDAVIRNFTVIGEAAARVPNDIRKKESTIPWDKIIGMRNFLVHEYFGITLSVVWNTAKTDLLTLKPLLKNLIALSKVPAKKR